MYRYSVLYCKRCVNIISGTTLVLVNYWKKPAPFLQIQHLLYSAAGLIAHWICKPFNNEIVIHTDNDSDQNQFEDVMNHSLTKRNISNTSGNMYTLNGNERYDEKVTTTMINSTTSRNIIVPLNSSVLLLN